MVLKILILTDGKMGDLVQCRGIAQQLTGDENIQEYEVQPGLLGSLPLKNMPLHKMEANSVLAKSALVRHGGCFWSQNSSLFSRYSTKSIKETLFDISKRPPLQL